MTTRRAILGVAGATAALSLLPPARAQGELPLVSVYKSPACGCCSLWEAHLRASGFRVHTRTVEDVTPVKRELGVPEDAYSCHTATVGGFVIEGHVPATDIKRLLQERTRAKGLAVPGMVAGSPGMEQGKPQPYATIAFDARRTWVFAHH